MKCKIKLTTAFKKGYKNIKKRGYDLSLLNYIINKLANGEKLEDKYHDHQLKGNFKDFRECHIKPDWLLIYLIEDNILTLTLVARGSHTDILDI